MLRILSLILLAALAGPPAAGAVSATADGGQKAVGTVIDAAAIRGYLNAFVQRQKKLLPQAQIRCLTENLPEPFAVPPGRLEVEVLPASRRLLHSRRFTLIFRVDGEAVQNLAVRARIEAVAPVAVAAGNLRRGTILDRSQLAMTKRDLADLQNPCFDPAQLVGKQLRRSLRRGQLVTLRDAVAPPLVRRGETVTIALRQGALLITARGEARQNGAEGDTIKVRNISSHKDILCRVAASGQVEVEL